MERIAPRPEQRLALITLHDSAGPALRTVDVHAWPLTMGRALDQQLVLDDPGVAAHHATLRTDESGQLCLQVGDTVNGVWLQGRHLQAGQSCPLPPGPCHLRLGQSTLLLRLKADTLAPEQPVPVSLREAPVGTARGGWLQGARLGAAALLVMAALVAKEWVALDPGVDFTDWLPALIGYPALILVWTGCWALLSKLFHHRLAFSAHLRTALLGLVVLELSNLLLVTVGASLGWPQVWRLQELAGLVLFGWLVWRHLSLLVPHFPVRTGAAVSTVVLVVGAIIVAQNVQETDRWSEDAYMGTLPPPWLNATRSVSVEQLVDGLAPLAQELEERVQASQDEEDQDLPAATAVGSGG